MLREILPGISSYELLNTAGTVLGMIAFTVCFYRRSGDVRKTAAHLLINVVVIIAAAVGSEILRSLNSVDAWTLEAFADAVADHDGGNHFIVFYRIMLPLAMPMVTTLFILSAIAGWNDYTTPMLYFPSFPNVAMGLYMVSQTLTRGDMSTYYAALVITTVPVVAPFAGFSDKIMKNYSIGGLKG